MKDASVPDLSLWPCAGLAPVHPDVSRPGELKTGLSTLGGASRREGSPPSTCSALCHRVRTITCLSLVFISGAGEQWL